MMLDGSYVVRIYRRGGNAVSSRRVPDPVTLAGTVENVDTGERGAFTGVEELWAFLERPGARKSHGRGARK